MRQNTSIFVMAGACSASMESVQNYEVEAEDESQWERQAVWGRMPRQDKEGEGGFWLISTSMREGQN
jgi:hypothetical protein